MADIEIATVSSASPWLTVIGVGEEGEEGLLPAARQALMRARYIFGGQRVLSKVSHGPEAHTTLWPSPLINGLKALLPLRYTPQVVVLVSGDPFYYGLGGWLTQHIPIDEMTVFPSVSSISHACNRLGWLQQHTVVLSLHGRDENALYRVLEDEQQVIVLTSDGKAPQRVADKLIEAGFGRSRITLLEALGGPHERCRQCSAKQFNAAIAGSEIHPLNLLALDLIADSPDKCHGMVPGRPDSLFENDGQITRSDIRAMTLARLRPHPGENLWDLGAGSGAIAIEWLRADTRMTAQAIERHADRCRIIQRNARYFGVPHLQLIQHDFNDSTIALERLPVPNAVFIGGGAAPHIIEYCMSRLADHGRLVINAVTLETEQLLHTLHQQHGGEMVRVGLEYVAPLGRMRGWTPARTVTQWCWHAERP